MEIKAERTLPWFWPTIDMDKPIKFNLHHCEDYGSWSWVSWYSQGIYIALYKFGRVRIPCTPESKTKMVSRIASVGRMRMGLDSRSGLCLKTHYDRDLGYAYGRICCKQTHETVSAEKGQGRVQLASLGQKE